MTSVDPQYHRKLETRLSAFDGRATTILGEMEAELQQDRSYHSSLIDLAGSNDNNVSSRATWLMKSALEKGKSFSPEQVDQILGVLGKITIWDAQLHICQSVQYLSFGRQQAKLMVSWLRKLVDHKRPFLRAWSLDALIRIGLDFPDLVEANELIIAAGNDPAASVRARARKLSKGAGL
ncbi:hypothetical protein SAMN02745824_2933 [Parasphingorhabdus marina DSM 22363]|uniref:HEAT repeat-containing protein n=1 Tax=Parasphingorhabdus marina DSM 22363 TaxID=1123272 RepID=A0A1N6GQ43_9SPHN|nr:hypothetical protein [Parasphingorhabdus marina]SIO09649.1 hypothetical protein SAMN02745824_2933 [Parasphingorhabdus marina DSM 22363]